MTAATISAPVDHAPTSRPARLRRTTVRFVAPALAAGLVAVASFSIRRGVTHHPALARSVSSTPLVMPTDAAIEDTWGIRFVAVRVLASSGLIDVRYEILDPSKADRLHAKGTENLPKLHVPGGGTVTAQSAMFHFHTTANPDAVARGFDILYGNQRGALRAGTAVDIVLADGMKLPAVPVTD